MGLRPFTGLRVTQDRVDAVLRAVHATQNTRVLVGIPAEEGPRQPEPGEKGAPLNNAVIAYIMETGSPAANIPARPTLVPGVTKAMGRIARLYEGALRGLLRGEAIDLNATHHKVGLVAQASVRREFIAGEHAPLAPSTLAKRRGRGRTGTRPLIDTGQLRNAINYVLRRRGAQAGAEGEQRGAA